jgi:hypothetical protein
MAVPPKKRVGKGYGKDKRNEGKVQCYGKRDFLFLKTLLGEPSGVSRRVKAPQLNPAAYAARLAVWKNRKKRRIPCKSEKIVFSINNLPISFA